MHVKAVKLYLVIRVINVVCLQTERRQSDSGSMKSGKVTQTKRKKRVKDATGKEKTKADKNARQKTGGSRKPVTNEGPQIDPSLYDSL